MRRDACSEVSVGPSNVLMRGLAFVFALALVACTAAIPEGQLVCTSDGECPPHWSCSAGLCYASPRDAGSNSSPDSGAATIDAGPTDAGAPDAGTPAAPVALAAGYEHTCALLDEGSVVCWGDNQFGQLGNGENTDAEQTFPVAVLGLPAPIEGLAAGRAVTCARSATDVYCWGSNDAGFGQPGAVGDPSVAMLTDTPVEVAIAASPHALAVGFDHACAITGDERQIECWGLNSSGQLGLGHTTSQDRPQSILELSGALELCAGEHHTCARLDDGTMRCWGRNVEGQLGDGQSGPLRHSTTPVDPGLTEVAAIACGHRHTCALAGSGASRAVYCWGQGDNGQLGGSIEGAPVASPRPITTTGLSDVTGVWVGGRPFFGGFTCAQRPEQLLCWGRDINGQLGNGDAGPINQPAPTPVRDLSAIDTAAAGGAHACAIASEAIWCWGRNDRGQLGDRSTTDRSAPVRVAPIEP